MGDLAIAAQVDPIGHGLDSFSKILGIKRAQQELQTGQYVQQQAQSEAAKSQQEVAEMKAAIPLMQDPLASGIIKKNDRGEYVPGDNAYSVIKRAMPMYGDKHFGDMVSAMKGQLEYKDAFAKVDDQMKAKVGSAIGSVVSTPGATNVDMDNSLNNLEEQAKGTPYEQDVTKMTKIARDAFEHVDKPNPMAPDASKPGPNGELSPARRHVGMLLARGGLQPEQSVGPQGMATTQPTALSTGDETQFGTVAPASEGAGFTKTNSVRSGIPPGYVLVTDAATGNHYYLNPQTNQSRPAGGGIAPRPASAPNVGSSATNAPMNAPPQRQIGEASAQEHQVSTNEANYQGNVKAAQDAPQQRDQIRQVRNILDTGVSTSTGAEVSADAERLLSQLPGLGGSKDDPKGGLAGAGSKAAKLDLLGKYLDRIAGQFGDLTGTPNHTDAAAANLRAQIGHTGYTNAALQEVMKYTDAQYSAAQAKDKAQAKFMSGGGSKLNQHEFEAKWRSAYDPQVFQIASEAPAKQHEILAEMKKTKPAEYASFVKKYRALKEMGADPQ